MEDHLYAQGRKAAYVAVLAASLGYFVDVYDLLLFGIIHTNSLLSIGVPQEDVLSQRMLLLNMQMGGMLIGGILWGILGDKKGRLSVLFGSIFIYSVANIANGFVHGVPAYAFFRLLAGIGIAGELGAGITLVSETMPKGKRGIGTTIIAGVGVLGAVLAVITAKELPWRTCYFVGGGMGFALLFLRIGVYESHMFKHVVSQDVSRGNFLGIFLNRKKAIKYVRIIFVGLIVWYVVGILIAFAPDFGKEMGMAVLPSSGDSVLYCYIGLSAGDLASGFMSQMVKSRKKVMVTFLTLSAICMTMYFTYAPTSLTAFYITCGLLGFSVGFWAIFVTIASEQFGTNIRATVTTTAPTFVRGALVPIAWIFQLGALALGFIGSAIAVGVLTLTVAFISLRELEETFGKDLHYIEE